MSQPINSHHPIYLADIGLNFYKNFIEEVEKTFFSKNS